MMIEVVTSFKANYAVLVLRQAMRLKVIAYRDNFEIFDNVPRMCYTILYGGIKS
jgi:hypothetical protein